MLAFIDQGSKISTAKFDRLGFRGTEPDSLAQAVFDADFRARADAVLAAIEKARTTAPTTGEEVVQTLAALVELQKLVDEFSTLQIGLMALTATALAHIINPKMSDDEFAAKFEDGSAAVLKFIRS